MTFTHKVNLNSSTDSDEWARFWFSSVGVNVLPQPTKTRDPSKFNSWKDWQDKPIPDHVFEKWIEEGKFRSAEGMAVIPGKVWRGEHAGKYLIFVDLDNHKAIEEFLTLHDNVEKVASLEWIAEKNFIVEQHPDDTGRAHVYFYSKVPFVGKSSDVTEATKEGFDANKLPAFEVKGEGAHGMAFCTPSLHKNGERYQILGTSDPITLEKTTAKELMRHIDSVCKRYNLRYLDLANGNGKALVPTQDLFKDDYVIYKDHNRHLSLLRAMDSMLKRCAGIFTLEEIKQKAHEWNQTRCVPPKDNAEFERNWREATKFISRVTSEEKQKKEKEQQQQQQRQGADDDDDDDEADDEEEDNSKKRNAKAKKALDLAISHSKELFLNEFGRGFAAMRVDDHVETHPLDEQHFKIWISGILQRRGRPAQRRRPKKDCAHSVSKSGI